MVNKRWIKYKSHFLNRYTSLIFESFIALLPFIGRTAVLNEVKPPQKVMYDAYLKHFKSKNEVDSTRNSCTPDSNPEITVVFLDER